MSLLLDALKRAEQEKLAKQGERPAAAERAAPPPGAQGAREAANLELAPLAGAPPAAAAQAAPHSDAAAAQTLFKAKAANEPRKSSTLLWAAGAVVVILIAAIGGYVWYSLQSLRPQITTLRPRALPIPSPTSADSAPPRLESLIPPQAPPPFRVEPGTEVTEVKGAATPTPTPTPAATPTTRPQEAAASLLREPRPTVAPPLKLAPTVEAPARVPSNVAGGYEQLRNGNLAEARRSYAAAIAADAASVDAQLGMATTEARLGNVAAAASHYRRALDLDPRNATAVAGLASLADYAQPEALEAQLRADIARYPQSAALYFSLGNLYAAQSRWHDAQSAFFEAHRLEPASADIAFNVAVALDHLGQGRLAADFYRRALDAARGQPAQFDPAPVARRLAELGR